MKLTTTFTTCMLTLIPLISSTGCKDSKAKDGKAKTSAKGGGNFAAITADPAPAAITPADKPPFESVTFQKTGKRTDEGWPELNAYNLSTKPITYMAITVYGYDKDGKQVVRSSPPLSWNGKIEPGAKNDWTIKVGGFGDPVPTSAVTWDVCWSGIKFDGGDAIDDFARCPDQKPRG